MQIAFYDDAPAGFGPLTLLRPVFELLCGQTSVRERVCRWRGATSWGAFLRRTLEETYREDHPRAKVNDFAWLGREPTLLLNGRWLPTPAALDLLETDTVGVLDGTVVALRLSPHEALSLAPDEWDKPLERIARERRPVEMPGALLRHPWDLVDHNPGQLELDFTFPPAGPTRRDLGPQVAVLGPRDHVRVDAAADVDPFVVLDARNGPISIAAGAAVQAFTRIEGPCHVAAGTQVFGANVRGGTTLGPVCRVGGEIEASILHGHVNKYHDGFLGHSYVAPWCNLGALTTNSDLKSDYSPVRVPVGGEMIDTGATKVGCFIGDHTKTALGSLFNTGSSIGVMCIVLPGGPLLPKHVPSFTNVWHGELADGWDLPRCFDLARAAMARRGQTLTRAAERLLELVWQQTCAERDRALQRNRPHLSVRAA